MCSVNRKRLGHFGLRIILSWRSIHNIVSAAKIHSESWKESHKSSCKIDFIEQHTVEHQAEYLHSEIEAGKQVYMLVETKPLGIDLSIRV